MIRWLLIASLALSATGCGDDDGGGGTDSGSTDTTSDAELDSGDDTNDDTTGVDASPDAEPDSSLDVSDADPRGEVVNTDAQDDGSTSADTADDADSADSTDSMDSTDAEGGDDTEDATEGGPCGDILILGPQHVDTTDECRACVEDVCCDEMLACEADEDCVGFRVCLAACEEGDGECSTACVKEFNAPIPASSAFASCRESKCGTDCSANSCVGSVVWAEPLEETLALTFTLSDFQTGNPISGATVKTCAKSDPECETPLDVATSSEVAGQVEVVAPTQPGGLDVFFAVDKEGYLPTDLWYVATFPEDALASGSVGWSIVSESTAGLISGLLGATLDAERGHVSYRAIDCKRFFTAGITVSADTADEGSTGFYIVGSLPSKTAPSTSPSGAGAILNLPPGPAKLIGVDAAGNPWGTIDLNVRAGRMIGTSMPPTP